MGTQLVGFRILTQTLVLSNSKLHRSQGHRAYCMLLTATNLSLDIRLGYCKLYTFSNSFQEGISFKQRLKRQVVLYISYRQLLYTKDDRFHSQEINLGMGKLEIWCANGLEKFWFWVNGRSPLTKVMKSKHKGKSLSSPTQV